MKKVLFAAAIAVLGFSSVSAQDAQEKKFGIKAGVNISNLAGNDVKDADGITSFHVGLLTEIAVSDKFSVQPELIYSAQGSKYIEDSGVLGINALKTTTTQKVNYINIPVIAKFYVTEGLSLEGGPQVGFLMSAKSKVERTIGGALEGIDLLNGLSTSSKDNSKEGFKSVDFAFGFGLGYKLDNGLNFSARYNLGLNSINKEIDGDTFDAKNNVFQVSVGQRF